MTIMDCTHPLPLLFSFSACIYIYVLCVQSTYQFRIKADSRPVDPLTSCQRLGDPSPSQMNAHYLPMKKISPIARLAFQKNSTSIYTFDIYIY